MNTTLVTDALGGLELAQLALGEQHLADDLGGGEVAVEALLRGRAERAIEHAAHLRGDAQRAAIVLRDEDHLEGLARIGPQQPLARAVGRALLADDLGRADLGPLVELRAKGLGEVRHRVELALAALVHPAHELAGAERLAAQLLHERIQRRPFEAEQVHAFLGRQAGHKAVLECGGAR